MAALYLAKTRPDTIAPLPESFYIGNAVPCVDTLAYVIKITDV